MFIQIMEFDTKQPQEIMSLLDEWRSHTTGMSTVSHDMMGRCHDRPNHYVAVMEFMSYEEAQRSNQMEETERFAKRMTEMCDGPIIFGDYDVIRNEN